ncbi:hypothetical protein LguiB_005948 [Lonicera macranthoides]
MEYYARALAGPKKKQVFIGEGSRMGGDAGSSPVRGSFKSIKVELLIQQLQFLDDEGAQAELWELSMVFVDTLIAETGCEVEVTRDSQNANLSFLIYKEVASSILDRKAGKIVSQCIPLKKKKYCASQSQ